MNEIETKVLNVNPEAVAATLAKLGAEKVLDVKLTVDWYRPAGTKPGEDPWYLRIRRRSDGTAEVTWKSMPTFVGISKQVKEIGFAIDSPQQYAELFEAIGLEHYAHQEKYRVSWKLDGWRFDLDRYPNIPPYLEIEGRDEAHLKEAISMLGLQEHRAVAEGERTLIQNEYQTDWYSMQF